MRKTKNYILAMMAVLSVACGGNNFNVTGKIEGASDTTQMVVEVSNNGMWLIVDSVKFAKDGSFKVTQPAAQYADVYRLRYKNKSIYFPIDSVETIDIKSDMSAFSTAYTLSGTHDAEDMMNVDKKAMQMHGADSASMQAWKQELAQKILSNPSGILAYYIINKYIGEQPLYNPQDKEDLKMIGAVANAYNSYKPNDPRTAYLVALTINNRRVTAPTTKTVVEVDEIPLLEISLQDENGKIQDLSKVSAQGKVVVLNFTVYNAELSPAFNKILSDEYKKYKGKNLEIYQIAYDNDEFSWRQAAKNLPWITVYDSEGINSANLMKYNVGGFPAIFIINRKGEIVERVFEIEKLSSAIAKYM